MSAVAVLVRRRAVRRVRRAARQARRSAVVPGRGARTRVAAVGLPARSRVKATPQAPPPPPAPLHPRPPPPCLPPPCPRPHSMPYSILIPPHFPASSSSLVIWLCHVNQGNQLVPIKIDKSVPPHVPGNALYMAQSKNDLLFHIKGSLSVFYLRPHEKFPM